MSDSTEQPFTVDQSVTFLKKFEGATIESVRLLNARGDYQMLAFELKFEDGSDLTIHTTADRGAPYLMVSGQALRASAENGQGSPSASESPVQTQPRPR